MIEVDQATIDDPRAYREAIVACSRSTDYAASRDVGRTTSTAQGRC